MRLKLLISECLLKPFYQPTFAKTLLVYPGEPTHSVTDLLAFIFKNFSFALVDLVQPSQLYLTTDDGFLLPPKTVITECLEKDQAIKLIAVKPEAKA